MLYHVLNRGNGRMRIFHKPQDFEAFERVLAEGLRDRKGRKGDITDIDEAEGK